MAHDPKLKAKVLKEWATGQFGEKQLADKYGIGVGTVHRWINPKTEQSGKAEKPKPSPKLDRYISSLERFGCATMDMLTAQAELLADKDYIRNKKTEEVIAHTKSIVTSLERFIQIHRPLSAPEGYDALSARAESEVVIPEVVDEASS